MRIRIFVLLLLLKLTCFSQSQLQYFEGSFDQALDSASKINKDIFLISKSLSCRSFVKFINIAENDVETIEFLNSSFIIFGYDMDMASRDDKRRLKEFYHSRSDLANIYFVSKDEKIIAEIMYSVKISQDEQLSIWKEYKNFKTKWKSIKKEKRKRNRNNNFDHEFIYKYIVYRQIKNSSFEYYQIQNVLTNYLGNIDTRELVKENNWDLIQQYGTVFSLNRKLTDIIATNKQEFMKSIGDSIISEYLLDKYYRYIVGRKETKVNRMAQKYPYNTIDEAKQAIELYRTRKKLQSNIEFIKN